MSPLWSFNSDVAKIDPWPVDNPCDIIGCWQHCGCWCRGAKAPVHQHPIYGQNTRCFKKILYFFLSEHIQGQNLFWRNKANLRDLIAATGLVILLKFDPNHRFFSPCDLEIWWMTSKNNRAPLLYYIKFVHHFKRIFLNENFRIST